MTQVRFWSYARVGDYAWPEVRRRSSRASCRPLCISFPALIEQLGKVDCAIGSALLRGKRAGALPGSPDARANTSPGASWCAKSAAMWQGRGAATHRSRRDGRRACGRDLAPPRGGRARAALHRQVSGKSPQMAARAAASLPRLMRTLGARIGWCSRPRASSASSRTDMPEVRGSKGECCADARSWGTDRGGPLCGIVGTTKPQRQEESRTSRPVRA